nr:immunoglobulin light chain junction region [Mus musculus]NSL97310.1 immunoglobulin light chain junction region [Mus musculus]NSL97438.1 immunoglobulin light chain junction region [Mus musculus]NSL97581.1 immunoglobulin light chain junction region [Mus musculus]NSL98067.1 immunoglobulin light chain junction region [Mus musculus]
CLQSDEFPYTF